MKKLFAALCIALCIMLAFTGCSGSKTENETTEAKAQTVDLDLTTLSSTMVYSEVNNMMTTPEDYVGKVIKMKGTTSVLNASDTGLTYYSVVIADATACCQQGIEFVWVDHDESEYPEVGTEVTVTGTFETYLENDMLFCHIVSDDVEFA